MVVLPCRCRTRYPRRRQTRPCSSGCPATDDNTKVCRLKPIRSVKINIHRNIFCLLRFSNERRTRKRVYSAKRCILSHAHLALIVQRPDLTRIGAARLADLDGQRTRHISQAHVVNVEVAIYVRMCNHM